MIKLIKYEEFKNINQSFPKGQKCVVDSEYQRVVKFYSIKRGSGYMIPEGQRFSGDEFSIENESGGIYNCYYQKYNDD